ncbi:MAG: FHA domain-containing serine/threonine-protein kinase [Planctomycetaceae bacterium]
MQAPTVATDFLELLERSELLSAAQVRKAVEKFELTDDLLPEDVARKLVQARVLTPFQAERLLEGRYRGFVIDGYRVREVLGVGGMGCVYIAEDRDQDRKIALKVMSTKHSVDAGMLARMKLEARAGMQIKHPNVIETYRIDSTGAVNYMVMEFMRGVSLHELVALHGPVQWQMTCDLFRQIASGLHAAHRLGIIHRDIKPANILVDATGVAKLLDFGLARLAGNSGDEFSLAMIFGHECLGTPDYIAPEQAEDSNSVKETADVYSLGCTMYVALTGRVPFPQKANAAKLKAHKVLTARSIGEIRSDVPPEVIAIVEKMMEKNPADRYQSAQQVADALKPYAKRQPVKFEFRQLVTLRAKQARDKEKAVPKKPSVPRSSVTTNSSITSSMSWVKNSGHHLEAEIDTFAADVTPAIRQPPPPKSSVTESRSYLPAPPRPVTSTRINVPRGWFIRRLKTPERFALTRVKTRIGTAPECEIRMPDTVVDERQCYIEYDGTGWQLRQESRSQPTFVDGKAQSYATLRHRSKVTFRDGSGFELISESEQERDRKFRQQMWILLGLGVLAGIVAAAVMMFL